MGVVCALCGAACGDCVAAADTATAAILSSAATWRDALILLVLGLAVDLRWFDRAWPSGLRALNELFLVDAGLYGFLAIRQLSETGFDFHLKWSDWKTGLREFVFFTPFVLGFGTGAGLYSSPSQPAGNRQRAAALGGDIFLYRRAGRTLLSRLGAELAGAPRGTAAALVIASVLFGLSHFNKRSAHFNWRYVLLATIAGIFYGRAWREHRRVPASTITHASVDWLWGLWF